MLRGELGTPVAGSIVRRARDGEAVVTCAANYGDIDYLGVEVHEPGIGHLLLLLEKANLANVRVIARDAVDVVRELRDGSFDAVNLFFPDPWPKKRHHKRRLVQQAFVAELARVLKSGGLLTSRRIGPTTRSIRTRCSRPRRGSWRSRTTTICATIRSHFGRRRNSSGEAGGWVTTSSTSSTEKPVRRSGWADWLRARSAHAGWRALVPAPVRQYTEPAPLAALFLGISSGAPYAMIAATLTTRLSQFGVDKRAITAFSLAFLVYNLKWLWAWVVDGVRLPVIGRLGQRVSWLLVVGVLVIVAIVNLALADPSASLASTASAAVFVAFAGATYDIVIDAYRIESLEPRQLGVGSGMSQYGWRIGSAAAGASRS